MAKKTYIRAALFGPDGGRIVKKATVTFHQGGQQVTLSASRQAPFFEGEVVPGRYTVAAHTENGLTSPVRTISAKGDFESRCIYLGRKKWPFYCLEDNVIPFEPRASLLAVCFTGIRPQLDHLKDYFHEVSRSRLPFLTVDHGALGVCSTEQSERLVWRCTNTAGYLQAIGMLASLTEKHFGTSSHHASDVRLGLPVDRGNTSRVLTNEYYVELKAPKAHKDVSECVTRYRGTLVKRPEYGRSAWIVNFSGTHYLEYLKAINEMVQKGFLSVGEPNLVSRLINHEDKAWDGPEFEGLASNLKDQSIPEAWCRLRTFLHDPAKAFGSPTVCVATIEDSGIDPSHPRLRGKLSDGTPRIALAYDFRKRSEIPAMGAAKALKSADDGASQAFEHGMRVIGIIAAKPAKGAETIGIASNTRQISFRHNPWSSTQEYAEMLLTVAGLNANSRLPENFPPKAREVLPHVINCSHGFNGPGCPTIIKRTLRQIATKGRNGLGTIVVYSAGNEDQGPSFLASDPNTIAVANSIVDAEQEQRREPSSNWGFHIDLCALGQGIESISLDKRVKAVRFGGTSAAAPMVTGVVALMLSANPILTFVQVRDILTKTAKHIDFDNRHPSGKWFVRKRRAFSQWYGHGRLDAGAAVAEAILLRKKKSSSKGLSVSSKGPPARK